MARGSVDGEAAFSFFSASVEFLSVTGRSLGIAIDTFDVEYLGSSVGMVSSSSTSNRREKVRLIIVTQDAAHNESRIAQDPQCCVSGRAAYRGPSPHGEEDGRLCNVIAKLDADIDA